LDRWHESADRGYLILEDGRIVGHSEYFWEGFIAAMNVFAALSRATSPSSSMPWAGSPLSASTRSRSPAWVPGAGPQTERHGHLDVQIELSTDLLLAQTPLPQGPHCPPTLSSINGSSVAPSGTTASISRLSLLSIPRPPLAVERRGGF